MAKKKEEKICEIDGCTRKMTARGLCLSHYDQWRRGKLYGYGPFTVKDKKVSRARRKGAKGTYSLPSTPRKETAPDQSGNDKLILLELNFQGYEKIWEALRKSAHDQIRSLDMQALAYISAGLIQDEYTAQDDLK